MLLNDILAQKFVDSIIENLGHNVNIMNKSGVIIASGSKERIGTYHSVAEDVIRQEKRIDIYKESEYIGVKEGVNMPFFYNNSIGGVVGITGNPKVIEKTANLVKMLLELMIDQESLKERVYSKKCQKTFFVNRLLQLKCEDDLNSAKQWGTKLGYDVTLPRIVLVIETSNTILNENPLYTKEGIIEFVMNKINSCVNNSSQNIISVIGQNKIIIIKSVRSKEENSVREELLDYATEIINKLNKTIGISLIVGIGSLHKTALELSNSYKEAKAMVKMGRRLKMDSGILYVKDHIFEYLFTKISSIHLEHFLSEYISKIEDKKEIIDTIESLLSNNMHLGDTSKELFVHRNTVIFRFNKIKDLLEIDPLKNDEDRILLRLLILFLKYQRKN
ncbi:MAG: helix-turn-helix domain-containing protein [Clostridiales bacterium]|nr:helix-turn-helix domain-containing protein [Clostridiales bacterium]